jgi:sugar (pentulose or hexulose) kinase
MTILAAVLGRPLAKSSVADAVALGAAILAAVGSGWYPSVAEAVAGMVSAPSEEVRPDPILAATYAPMLDVYGRLFSETSRIVSDAQIAYGRVPRPQ